MQEHTILQIYVKYTHFQITNTNPFFHRIEFRAIQNILGIHIGN